MCLLAAVKLFFGPASVSTAFRYVANSKSFYRAGDSATIGRLMKSSSPFEERKLESNLVPRLRPRNIRQTANAFAGSLLSSVGWLARRAAFVKTCAIKACEYGKPGSGMSFECSGAR